MAESISLTGLAASDVVPGAYVEVNFAQGASSSGTGVYGALIIANKSSAGIATPDTVVYSQNSVPALSNETDAITLFGNGSPAHRMWRQFVKVNSTTPVSVICPTESVGTQATGTITYATTATASGTTRVYVGERFVEYSFAVGDTVTTTALAVSNLVNSQLDLTVTAASVAGVVTLTWKTKGPQGNWGRYSATTTSGAGTTGTVATTFMTGGATADSYTAALATILPYRYYYIITEASAVAGASAQTSAVVTQVNSQALPITGLRQRVFNASVDTLANTTTFATTLNAARAEIVWSQNQDRAPEELAAFVAGVYALEEQPLRFRCNFSGYGNDAVTSAIWNVLAPRSGTAPTRANILSALNNGITPIGINANRSTYLVKRITTRCLNGATPDYRIRDAHKVTVCDRFADDLVTKHVFQFSGKKIGNDPLPGERSPGGDVVTPRVVRAANAKLLREYEENDVLENVTACINGMQVQRETTPTTRIASRIALDVIDILDQTISALDQAG